MVIRLSLWVVAGPGPAWRRGGREDGREGGREKTAQGWEPRLACVWTLLSTERPRWLKIGKGSRALKVKAEAIAKPILSPHRSSRGNGSNHTFARQSLNMILSFKY